ncbi:hypothetical protein ABB28_09745 [Stenotrophomonas chelatiphaga]|uniref:Uncharacterized protein n=1 Tax=Stenotrophomonas chelatiphaga TaxID=517011 RepID=A0A0R0CUZ8_9GAMM|nr:hypothetical protein ABB28_09745 [Stenotrophomonas chelatiphaga]
MQPLHWTKPGWPGSCALLAFHETGSMNNIAAMSIFFILSLRYVGNPSLHMILCSPADYFFVTRCLNRSTVMHSDSLLFAAGIRS